jgi:zinc protease
VTVVGTLLSAVLVAGAAGEPSGGATPPAVVRRPGPAGSLLIVESNRAVPLVHVLIASRSGSASDPRHREGLTNLAAEWARRGAGDKSRTEIDAALDALGATLEIRTESDSTRFEGTVLSRNLDAYLGLVGDIIVRPTFTAAELARTRREVLAQMDEERNDDRALCARFFVRNVYADHPYGHPPDGLRASLDAARADEISAHFKRHFGGRNLVFAFSGDVDADELARTLGRAFRGLSDKPAPGPNALELRRPLSPSGWRIQLVDKPDRTQTQLMFGHAAMAAGDADFIPLQVGLTAFGGQAMNATLMNEVRRKRGLAYGAYLILRERRTASLASGWVFSGTDKTVATLKLVLKLYVAFMEKGLTAAEVAFFQRFLIGNYAAAMDDPEHRLAARVMAEIAGRPPDFVDRYPALVRAVTQAEVNAAIKRHVRARDLAITMVANGPVMKKRLLEAKVQEGAIDVVPYDSY